MTRTVLLRLLPMATALLALSACSNKSGGGSDILASASIGPEGGELRITGDQLDGTTLTVPAGALDATVLIEARLGQISNVPGATAVGAAVQLDPGATDFATPADLILPYDPLSLPSAVDPRDIVVGWRNSTGMVSGLPIEAVDESRALVRVKVTRLGAYWPAAAQAATAASLLPLNAGDTYRFGDGLVINVARVSNEPNLPQVDLAKVSFVRTGQTAGFYIDDSADDTLLLGNFETGAAQEVYDTGAVLLRERTVVGDQIATVTSYTGYRPIGTSIVAYTGILRHTSSVPDSQTLSVPAGTFENCFRLDILVEFNSTQPMIGQRLTQMWLAPGVGPVRITFDGGTTANLVEATVDGSTIGG